MEEFSTNTNEALRTLGKYALIEKLGEGHLGPVFRGFDQDLGKPVVIRILSEDIKWDANIEYFFSQVCKTVAKLEHPNIISVFDAAREEETRYIVMESLGSGSLKSLLESKPAMSVEARLSIIIQIVEGLNFAHKKTVLHRDLKPSKIHVMQDGSVKIRDFAMVHVLIKHLPRRIVHWKTPIYLSPEQIQKKDSDERADIFSVGTIFYELMTYHHPFHDSNGEKASENTLPDDPALTFEKYPDVPPGFWRIAKKCLAADPLDRYRSMDDLLAACKDLQKSLAEDAQLMLSELYASQDGLKKAAAQPNASPSTVGLFQDIQKLSRGDKKPDCVSLDRMTTALIEQYPIIRAAADAPNAVDLQIDTEVPEIEDEVPVKSAVEPIPESTPTKGPIEESPGPDFESAEKLWSEPEHPSMASDANPDMDPPPAAELKEDVAVPPSPNRRDSIKVHYFDMDHSHGLLNGSCRGVLMVSNSNIEYSSYSGQHGFQVPFKLLKISRIDRKSVKLSFASDNKHFESFKFQDGESAERFNRTWEDLKAASE